MKFPVGLKLLGKYKKTSTPPEDAIRDSWGPILFKHCRVQYNKETKKLELMKGEFVGKYKIKRAMSLVKDRKCEVVFNYDDDDDDAVEDDDVDNDDPVGVVPDNIFCRFVLPMLEKWKHLVRLERSFSCTFGRIFPDWN